MEHWFVHNIQPLVDAFGTGDPEKIKFALWNFFPLYYKYIKDIFEDAPHHVFAETVLVLFILYILFVKRDKSTAEKDKLKLSKKEEDELIKEWVPEPLVQALTQDEIDEVNSTLVVTSGATTTVTLEGYDEPKLNFTTFDFLGLSGDPVLKDSARKALTKYGCGSCGPRGFYGTIDLHVQLEQSLARYFGCPEAIIYSDSANTPPSTIPAFAKRGDLIVADAGVNETMRTGLQLSRATILFHKHNDMEDLERVLKSVRAQDEKLGRQSDCQRRFIVAEGLYRNYGTIMKLKEVVALKHKYLFRLIVDETFSIGVLGKTGKGVSEHVGMPVDSIDVLSGSLAHSLGSIGGFCVGSQEVVDHQRLSASGYVFSASSPPFVAAVALTSLDTMQKRPELLATLHENVKTLVTHLSGIKGLAVTSDAGSPVIHVQVTAASGVNTSDHAEQETALERMCVIARDRQKDGVVAMISRCMPRETVKPPASLRLCVSAAHTKAQLKACADAIKAAAKEVF